MFPFLARCFGFWSPAVRVDSLDDVSGGCRGVGRMSERWAVPDLGWRRAPSRGWRRVRVSRLYRPQDRRVSASRNICLCRCREKDGSGASIPGVMGMTCCRAGRMGPQVCRTRVSCPAAFVVRLRGRAMIPTPTPTAPGWVSLRALPSVSRSDRGLRSGASAQDPWEKHIG